MTDRARGGRGGQELMAQLVEAKEDVEREKKGAAEREDKLRQVRPWRSPVTRTGYVRED